MLIHKRCFDPRTDIVSMIALAALHPQENLRIIDLPYRLSSWALDDPQNACLWLGDDSKLVGWVVMQAPFWTIDFSCQPDLENQLLPEMLAWVDWRARVTTRTDMGHPNWFIMVFRDQESRIHVLEDAGFKSQADVGEDSWSKVLLLNDFQEFSREYPAPKGFIVRPIAGEKEVFAYVDLHREVFETKNMTVDWRRRTLQAPGYIPELDLVVETPDGKLAAFCICWQMDDPIWGHCGQVEPLGCRAEYRHLGLGRVALAEGLHRLKQLGVRKVFVETDSYRNTANRLYESMGFHVNRDVLIFRKDYPEKAA